MFRMSVILNFISDILPAVLLLGVGIAVKLSLPQQEHPTHVYGERAPIHFVHR
jgi:hypothetical protein